MIYVVCDADCDFDMVLQMEVCKHWQYLLYLYDADYRTDLLCISWHKMWALSCTMICSFFYWLPPFCWNYLLSMSTIPNMLQYDILCYQYYYSMRVWCHWCYESLMSLMFAICNGAFVHNLCSLAPKVIPNWQYYQIK